MSIHWKVRSFSELSTSELHDILRLRVDVFVVEQQCPYAEVDGQDPTALHVIGTDERGAIGAYGRILPALPGELPHIGRIVIHPDHRGKGLAHQLMDRMLAELRSRYGSDRSMLAAQAHLEGLYASHGYHRIGDIYVWDGIPHVDMERLAGGRTHVSGAT
jgi:ElaA protein